MNSTTLIERIEFQAVAPNRALPGLDTALHKLEALGTALNAINQRLASVTTLSAFKRTTKGIEDSIKQLEGRKGKGLSLKQVASNLGLPTEDLRQYILRVQESITQDIAKAEKQRNKLKGTSNATARADLLKQQRAMESELKNVRDTFSGSGMNVRSAPAAARVISAYQKQAMDEVRSFSHAQAATLQSLLGGGNVGHVDIGAAAQTAAKVTQAAETASRKKKKKERTSVGDVPADASLVETKTIKVSDQPDRTVRRYQDPKGNVYEQTEVEGTNIRLVERDRLQRRAEKDLKSQLASLKADAGNKLAGVNTAAGIGAFRKNYTAQARALLEGDGARYVEAQLEPLVDAFIGKTLPGLIQKSVVESGTASARLRAAGSKNIKKAEAEARKAARARTKSEALMTEGIVADETLPSAAHKLLHGPSIEDMQAADARKAAGGGSKPVPLDAHVREFEQAQKAAKRLADEEARLRKEAQLLSGDFVQNTVKVAAWTASVGILYGSLGLLQHGFMRTVEIGAQTARLDQVFTQVGGSTRALTGDILHLAAVNGRSTDEAMQAAIQWSRMGLSRKQVNEAVRQSLVAANVAEMTAAEATDHLQAIMRNYNLQVSQLGTVLGELNQISNTYNVTNEEMLTGISRTASAAKQAGLPLQELMGVIGATVGATKQSGANIGNALKSVILALSSPELQEKLRMQFKFESTDGEGNLKNMSTLLGDLYVRYQKMIGLEKQSMLFSVAGKTQANRLAAMMDSYVAGQVRSINAQLHLNSAESENAKIMDSMKAQLTAVTSEWEKFVLVQASSGPVQALTQTTKALRGILTLLNTPVGSAATTGMLALFTVAGARTLMSGIGGSGFVSKSKGRVGLMARQFNDWMSMSIHGFAADHPDGISGRVGRGASGLNAFGDARGAAGWGQLKKTFGDLGPAAAKLGPLASGLRVVTAAQSAWNLSLAATSKALALTMVTLYEFAVPLLAVAALVYGFNAAMEALGLTSDKAADRLARFNAQAEKAHAAAGAMSQAVRLMTTAQEAFSTRGNAVPEEEAGKLIRGVAEAYGMVTEASSGQTDELEKQLALLHAQKNDTGLIAVLGEHIAKTQALRREQMEKEYDAKSRSIAATKVEIDRLKTAAAGSMAWIGYDKRKKNIDEQEGNLRSLEGAQIAMIADEQENITGEIEKQLAASVKHLSALESERDALAQIAGIYDQIRTVSPEGRAEQDKGRTEAQLKYEQDRVARLQQELETQKPGQAERDKRVAELTEHKGTLLAQQTKAEAEAATADEALRRARAYPLAGLAESVNFGNKAPVLIQAEEAAQRVADVKAAIAKANKDIGNAQNGIGFEGGSQVDYLDKTEQIKKAQAEIKKLKADLPKFENNAGLLKELSRSQEGQRQADRGMSANDFGRNETEKTLRQIGYAEQRIGELKAKTTRTTEEQSELMQLTNSLEERRIALANRHYDIERDINQVLMDNNREMVKSFMSAGPAEMLRKLAAFKLAMKGGMTQGQFFGMSPGMREDYGKFNPQWSPAMIELMRERAQNGSGRMPGFASGGYTGDGNPNEIAGFVHKDEYVIPSQGLAALGGAGAGFGASFARDSRYATAMASRTGTKAWNMMTMAMDAERIGHTATETAAYARAAQLQASQASWAGTAFGSAKWARGARFAGNAAAGLALAKEAYDGVNLARDFKGTTGRYADSLEKQGLFARMWEGSGNGAKGVATLFGEKARLNEANSYSGTSRDWTSRPNSRGDITAARRDRDARMARDGIAPRIPIAPYAPPSSTSTSAPPVPSVAPQNHAYGPPTYRQWAWQNQRSEHERDAARTRENRENVARQKNADDYERTHDTGTPRSAAWARQREESARDAARRQRNRSQAAGARAQENQDRGTPDAGGYRPYVPPPTTSTSSTPTTGRRDEDAAGFNTALKTATGLLDQFGPAVNRATQQLVEMAARCERLYTSAPAGGALPALPQGGGVGGARGFGS